MKEGLGAFFVSKSKLFALGCFSFLFVVMMLSWWDVTVFFSPKTPDYVHYYAPNQVTLTGIIIDEPDRRIADVRYTIESQEIVINGFSRRVKGKVYFKIDLYPEYSYGDILEVKCSLQVPKPIKNKDDLGREFRYDIYLARYHIYSICERPSIEKISSGGGNFVFAKILELKNILAHRIISLWPEPKASFMAGLLYGYRGGLGTLNDLFARTGLTHIVAVSGFNITIIASIFINLCLWLCVPRQKAFWAVSGGIILFVIFTGASASVVRAGVMGIIVLLAKYVGRVSRIGNVLLLAAVIMTVQNPLVLMFDAGFQLSFLSTLGLVYVSPYLSKYNHYFPKFLGIQENITATLSAIIATLPLILYQFGRLSLVAPFANVLVLWIIPWLMLSGALAVFFSFMYEPFGLFLAWFGWLGMEYCIKIVTWFARLPYAAIDISIPIWGMIAAYLILGYCLVYTYSTNKKYTVLMAKK